MINLPIWRKSLPASLGQPRNPFTNMQTALDKAMEDFFYNAFEWPSFPTQSFENLAITPAIDIVDDENHFKVEVELPGMGEEDIQVAIHEGILTIKGEKETSQQDKDKNYWLREIRYGSYERQIRLPDSVDVEKAKATFKKGMLWVDIPKKSNSSKGSQPLKVEKV